VLAEVCRTAMTAAEPGGGRQLAAARWFARFAGAQEAARLRIWLDGDGVPEGLRLDPDLRWTLLHRLAVLGLASEADIEAEYQRDHTALGLENAARARAARPDSETKARAWRLILDDTELSNRQLAATAEGFWQPEQVELTQPYVQRYFTEMPAMARRRTPQVAFAVVAHGFPQFAVAPATLEAGQALLARDDVIPLLRRVVVDGSDEIRRALAARALA
jgi:aminopeptidase N